MAVGVVIERDESTKPERDLLGDLLGTDDRDGKLLVPFRHSWGVDEATGDLNGAISGQQAARVQALITAAGQPIEYHAFPTMPHFMHAVDPERYTGLLVEWAARLASEDETRKGGIFAAS